MYRVKNNRINSYGIIYRPIAESKISREIEAS